MSPMDTAQNQANGALMAASASPANQTFSSAPPDRLVSLDALRGFDMFWISGGDAWFPALAKATGWAWALAVAGELDHAEWAGFHFYDLIFPLFLFISGVTLPLLISRRQARGESQARIFMRLARRGLLLVVLGIVYCAHKVSFDVPTLRFGSVLGRIGLAGFGAGVIVLYSRPRAWVAWVVGILIAYWALMTFVPAPGQAAPSFAKGVNWADVMDQKLLPGKLYEGNHDPEGLLSTIPAVATALLGALAGSFLLSKRPPWRKVLVLAVAGGLLWAAGKGWGYQFPVIKKIWTSSFVLVAGGWSLMLLAFFYAVVDCLRFRRWAFLFVLIGMNPLTLYVLRGTKWVDFKFIGTFFFGFLWKSAPAKYVNLCELTAMMAVQFIFLYWLYRKKFFLRL